MSAVTARCLAGLHFASFLFLSSTRVYARATATSEDTSLPCAPADPSDLYNLTKLAGEAVCLADPRQTVRVVRLSNVYGGAMPDDTFLGQLLREGRGTGAVRFRQSAKSSKDYVSLAEVTRLLPAIAAGGRHRLYNLAAGVNTSHAAIAVVLRRRFGWHVDFAPGAPHRALPADRHRAPDCRIRRRVKQSFSRPRDTGGRWTGGPMLTIDERGGRVILHGAGRRAARSMRWTRPRRSRRCRRRGCAAAGT